MAGAATGGGGGRGHPLALTGERTLPGVDIENYWYRRHEAAYLAALPRCAGLVVLEAGCGEGYGAALIATVARQVVAVDYDPATVAHVAAQYPSVRALRGNLGALPVAGRSVDVVVGLQVVEHLWDQAGFVRDCARALRPGGQLILSTPNRLTFSSGRSAPLNPFHTRELAPAELADLLTGNGFAPPELTGLRHGPRLSALDSRHGGSLVAAQLAEPPAGWPAGLRSDVASVRADDFVLSAADIEGSLDVVATARPA